MKFCEAIEKLKSGSKVTRDVWKKNIYFKINDKRVLCYKPRLSNYFYNQEIMSSSGWIIHGLAGKYNFSEIIPYLKKGHQASLSNWEDSFIYLDKTENCLLFSEMETFEFAPDFDSFNAEDWVTIE